MIKCNWIQLEPDGRVQKEREVTWFARSVHSDARQKHVAGCVVQCFELFKSIKCIKCQFVSKAEGLYIH